MSLTGSVIFRIDEPEPRLSGCRKRSERKRLQIFTAHFVMKVVWGFSSAHPDSFIGGFLILPVRTYLYLIKIVNQYPSVCIRKRSGARAFSQVILNLP